MTENVLKPEPNPIIVQLNVTSYDLSAKTATVAFVEQSLGPYVKIEPAVGPVAAYLHFLKNAPTDGKLHFVLNQLTTQSGEKVAWTFDSDPGRKPTFRRKKDGVDDSVAFPPGDRGFVSALGNGGADTLKCRFVFKGKQSWDLKFSIIGFGASLAVDPEIQNDND